MVGDVNLVKQYYLVFSIIEYYLVAGLYFGHYWEWVIMNVFMD